MISQSSFPRLARYTSMIGLDTNILEWWEEIWLKATGKSWKALTDFPRRLQKMAGEVESLNANFFSIPGAGDNPALVSFHQLPTVLRSYAEVLSHHTMRIPRGLLSPSRSRRIVELTHFAKAMTGRYCDREIADLFRDPQSRVQRS